MSSNLQRQEAAKTPDPNIPQRNASDPEASVWVNASAGTGKTKVLTDRVLRLLLPDAAGNRRASDPTRILCITFTKAAASEMAARVSKILSKWAVMDEAKLIGELQKLLNAPPSEAQVKTARRLFSDVIDAPGGLKIMTIHSFCQSVLGRFPLEANIPPNFTVIDEAEADKLVHNARRKVLAPEKLNANADMAESMARLAAEKNENQVTEVIKSVLSERLQLRRIIESHDDLDAFYAALCQIYNCPPEISPDQAFVGLDFDALWAYCKDIQNHGSAAEKKRTFQLQIWLECDQDQKLTQINMLYDTFLTTKKEPRKKPHNKDVIAACPNIDADYHDFVEQILKIDDDIKNQKAAILTRDLISLGAEVLKDYAHEKELRGALDYDDLIFKTHELLQSPETAEWVLFKLDGGLDHLLIDEAQDTNPEQWDIINALSSEFFAGLSARDQIDRTIFTVGDEKQSIYSFQRADPDAYQNMRHHFRGQIERAEKKWADIDMSISFRSTETVLNLVDAVFDSAELRATLGPSHHELLKHHSHRERHGGSVELWPVLEADERKDDKPQGWQLPLEVKAPKNIEADLAEQIAREVQSWLKAGRELPSKGRPLHAGDIMVLVKNRTKIVGALQRAFRKYDIPVAGVDKITLSENIAVMDMLALAQISILPEDDLTLAAVLKSPFVGLSEDELFALSHKRSATLWQALKSHEKYAPCVSWLKTLARIARKERPYEFFSVALKTECPAGLDGYSALCARLGRDIDEPLGEFLNMSIHYEQDNLPSVQGFIHWFQKRDVSIKRQMEEAGREVRIMTVHGSKGLQAPIVFMPDTILGRGGQRENENLLWPNQTDHNLPLYAPRSDDQSQIFKAANQRIADKALAEYNRLLYVALTRAEDELYICAAGKLPKSNRHSWYHLVEDGFARLGISPDQQTGRYRIEAPHLAEVKQDKDELPAPSEMSELAAEAAAPLWLSRPAPAEQTPPRPLLPSRPDEDEPAVNSPLDPDNSQRFLRGNITHKLLELLPDLPPEKWQSTAEIYVADIGASLTERVKASIVSETLNVLSHPDFAPVFGVGSLAEVPITGKLTDHTIISAQIDRMLITGDEIFIIDYKTNRPSPDSVEDVPAIYKKQLKLYRQIIEKLYPERKIRTALLWTDRADLMEIIA